ncbi:condensin-2 complex subunit H2 isoform X2 [Ziziphus jujuba]|uniref:Condensin-2 complex subunit H2 n=1 Tax=Ziziphus jujuba TaxID=326968 RepID=A0A6P4AVQ2_ZIZJJ|nr:condensin-2 complex subunit H2 isoform X2 [Ziziphus jujuba]
MQFISPVPPPPPECSTFQLSLKKMSSSRAEPKGKRGSEGSGGGGFHRVQAERDLASNWEVDLTQKLEEYLIKICSGEIPNEADGLSPVNFAEAALLLQGSVQVYGRKVEYLYALVLRALEFLSQRQQEQLEGASVQAQENGGPQSASADKNDLFWGLDDIPVEANIRLDSLSEKDVRLKYLAKPPANLDVREGDCLDSSGDAGELESYLLATSDLYRGFILLDPRDAVAVPEDLDGDKPSKGQNSAYRSSSKVSNRKSNQSPTRRSGGTAFKSPLGKSQDASANQSSWVEVNNGNIGHDFSTYSKFFDSDHGFDMDDRDSEPGEIDGSDSEDDPWKPLNPHEPGTLRIKPFRKVQALKRNVINTIKPVSVATLFPPARLHGPISPELRKIWEMRRHEHERPSKSESPSLYERLRQSLTDDGYETFNPFLNPEDGNEDYENETGMPNFDQHDDDMPENIYMDKDVPFDNKMHDDDGANFGTDEAFGHEGPNPHTNLEDLCRSHLDALLASIAETEKQSELVARVSTWKQKIEHNLEEQETHPAFDIHDYGERILEKLSFEAEDTNILPFTDVVKGQEKYDVARSFSALLQLVNNGNVKLDRSGVDDKSFCYTSEHPFHVRLLSHDSRQKKAELKTARKRKVLG